MPLHLQRWHCQISGFRTSLLKSSGSSTWVTCRLFGCALMLAKARLDIASQRVPGWIAHSFLCSKLPCGTSRSKLLVFCCAKCQHKCIRNACESFGVTLWREGKDSVPASMAAWPPLDPSRPRKWQLYVFFIFGLSVF